MNIVDISNLEQQLGPLTYPLLLCALVALVLIIERILILSYHTLSRNIHASSRSLLQQHQQETRELREEIMSVWLHKQRLKLCNGLRLLNIVTLLAPLLGLLGTVIGLIQVFDTLGVHTGPIEPSLLAEGLGIAMKTTAVGLVIAVPALLGAHGFQLWADKIIQGVETEVNLQNLVISGIQVEAFS